MLSYVNTSTPHPATAVNNLGLKSLAGLIAPPQLKVYVILKAAIMPPMHQGNIPPGGHMLNLSVKASAQTVNRKVPNICNAVKKRCAVDGRWDKIILKTFLGCKEKRLYIV